jgi:hypothetical protein
VIWEDRELLAELARLNTAMDGAIVEGEVVVDGSIALPAPTVQPPWIRE